MAHVVTAKVTEMFVLSHYGERLIGIFSTEDKARIAAEEYMKFISRFFGQSGPVVIEEVAGETLYGNGQTVIHITKWVIDKALIDGEWKVL